MLVLLGGCPRVQMRRAQWGFGVKMFVIRRSGAQRPSRRRALPAAAAVAVGASALGLVGSALSLSIRPLVATATAPPHVMVIMEENKAYSASDATPYVIGNSTAPYINQLATTYTSATKWYGITSREPG